MARVTAAHDMPTNMTTSATGPHLSSYRALGSRRAIRLARHTNIHSEYTMKTMATGARIAPHIPEATACRLDVAAAAQDVVRPGDCRPVGTVAAMVHEEDLVVRAVLDDRARGGHPVAAAAHDPVQHDGDARLGERR